MTEQRLLSRLFPLEILTLASSLVRSRMRLAVGTLRSALAASEASAFLLNGEGAFRRLELDDACLPPRPPPPPAPPRPAPPPKLLWRGAAPMRELCREPNSDQKKRARASPPLFRKWKVRRKSKKKKKSQWPSAMWKAQRKNRAERKHAAATPTRDASRSLLPALQLHKTRFRSPSVRQAHNDGILLPAAAQVRSSPRGRGDERGDDGKN